MKRLIVLTTALLCCLLARAQEASTVGSTADLSVITRLDINPSVPMDEKGVGGVNLGFSSLYTSIDGEFSGSWSYSGRLNLLSSDPKALYQNFLHSDELDFVNWFYVTYSTGDFSFSLGKDILYFGGYEIDADDADAYSEMNSTFWNSLSCWQLGGNVSYSPSDAFSLSYQLASSPFNELAFDSGLLAHSLYLNASAGVWSTISSFNLVEMEKGSFIKNIFLGNQFEAGDFTIKTDLADKWIDSPGKGELLASASLQYSPSDKFDIIAKVGYEERLNDDDEGCYCYGNLWSYAKGDGIVAQGLLAKNLPLSHEMIDCGPEYCFAGLVLQYYPLKESRDLRLHIATAANNYSHDLSLNFGITYFFNTSL